MFKKTQKTEMVPALDPIHVAALLNLRTEVLDSTIEKKAKKEIIKLINEILSIKVPIDQQ